jgi:flagellar biosynthetic protein FliR
MNLPEAWLAEVATFALATSRLAGMIATAPFPGSHVPMRMKVGLLLVLAWLATSSIPAAHIALDLHLIAFAAVELSLGLLVGITFRITFSCAEVMGSSFSQSLGLTSAHVFDPMLETEDAVPGRIGTLLAMTLVLGLGTHRVAIAYLLESFRALPIGSAISVTQATTLLVDYAGAALETGVRLALPVAAVALAVQVTLALVARASPSLQIFSVGLALSVGAGLLAIMGSLDDLALGLASELGQLGPRIDHVLEAARGVHP